MGNKLMMSQKEECDNYNLIIETIDKLVDMCDNTEAIVLRDELLELFTTKYSEPLFEILGLQEELGCPLEEITKLRKANYIYRDDGVVFGFIGINFNDEDKLILYNDDECNTFTSNLRLSDYKKTWFLRKDKSE